MIFQLFPKTEYRLETSHTRAEVVDLLSANIRKNEPLSFKSILGELTRDARYFEGEITDVAFNVSHAFQRGYRSNILPPDVKGTFAISQKGSIVHIVSTVPPRNYSLIVFFLLVILFGSLTRAAFNFWLPVLPAMFLAIWVQRYFYFRRTKKDKEKLTEILDAIEIPIPMPA